LALIVSTLCATYLALPAIASPPCTDFVSEGCICSPVRDGKVAVELVAARDGIAPGGSATIALRMQIDFGWHTYWVNAGDSGYGTSITWELPEGYTASELQFPVPKRFTTAGSPGFGYGDRVYHLATITAPADAAVGSEVTIRGTADWLVCDESSCLPGGADLEFTFVVKPVDAINSTFDEPEIVAAAAKVPKLSAAGPIEASLSGDTLEFRLPHADPAGLLASGGVGLFARTGGLIDHSAEAAFSADEDRLVVSVAKNEFLTELPQEIDLVVAGESFEPMRYSSVAAAVDSAGDHSVVTGATTDVVASTPPPTPFANSASSGSAVDMVAQNTAIEEILSWGVSGGQKSYGFLTILVFAFLGGIILNIMPCVFPVLGVKIMGFVQQAGEDKKSIRQHGLVFGLGVLMSLWLLAAVILIVRYTGEQAGWGFQLQNPGFVLVMIVIMFVFALNLSGLFEVGTSLIGAGQELQNKQGYGGSFFSGVLAVVIATPCTGPFMGAALTFALGSGPLLAFMVFTFLGLGLAMPYVVLSFLPELIQKLPRPGAWMETFKQFMAFPMYATAVWLLFVYGKIAGTTALEWLFHGLVLLALALWAYGRFCVPSRSKRTRSIAVIAALLMLVGAGILAREGYRRSAESEALIAKSGLAGSGKVAKYGLEWEPINAVSIVEHRKAGRAVFIDFTANW